MTVAEVLLLQQTHKRPIVCDTQLRVIVRGKLSGEMSRGLFWENIPGNGGFFMGKMSGEILSQSKISVGLFG